VNNLTGVSLFAGIGGFEIAMQRQGVEVVASVEIDKHASKLLQARFPLVKHFTDVKTVTGKELIDAGFKPESGIITGGFPCQDLSVAGRRAGLEGERSGLFWEIARILEETKSKYFIVENVPGLLSSSKGRDMGIVIGTLVELGYGVAWRVLDAQYFGVPQRRRRVFIVGCLGDETGAGKILFERNGLRRDSSQGKQAGQNIANSTPRSFGQSSFGGYTEGPATITATSYKRPEDNVVVNSFTSSSFAQYKEGVGTLRANGGDLGGGSESIVVH
jgi:DNA (cytosine-5)-methyltransferase 1